MSIKCPASWCVSLGPARNCSWHGLHHTLIKTPSNFSTDSRPSHCNYGGMLPCVCCCCSNLHYTVPRDAGARCQCDVSRRDRERLGKLCNIPLGGKYETGAQVPSWYFLAWIICEKDFQNLHEILLDLANWRSLIKSEGKYSTQKAGHDPHLEHCHGIIHSLINNSEKDLSLLKTTLRKYASAYGWR